MYAGIQLSPAVMTRSPSGIPVLGDIRIKTAIPLVYYIYKLVNAVQCNNYSLVDLDLLSSQSGAKLHG